MTNGDYVEHRVHRIRGTVLRHMGQGRHAKVLWDDDGSPTESGQRYLDSHRYSEPGPVYSVALCLVLRFVSAVEQLGELV